MSNPAARAARPEPDRERLHDQRLVGRDLAPHDRQNPVGRVPQPEPAGEAARLQGTEQRRPDHRQDVDVLMPVDEGRRRPERALEGVELPVDLGADLGRRQEAQ